MLTWQTSEGQPTLLLVNKLAMHDPASSVCTCQLTSIHVMQAYANNFRMGDGSVYVSSGVRAAPGAPHLTGTTEEIETLRPRSPPPNQRH